MLSRRNLQTAPLILRPVLTHFCAQLKGLECYSEKFEVLETFPGTDETACVAWGGILMRKGDIAYTTSNCEFLTAPVTQLKASKYHYMTPGGVVGDV
jgi:hypothetical protein